MPGIDGWLTTACATGYASASGIAEGKPVPGSDAVERELTRSIAHMPHRRFAGFPLLAVAALAAALAASAAQAFLRPVPGLQQPAPKTPAAQGQRQEPGPRLRDSAEQAGQNRFYDPANPAYGALQKANEALAGFPVDAQGHVDWMSALATGRIKPLADLRGQAQMEPLDLDIIMKNTQRMPYVRFPHRSHTLWLDCSNCHPAPFEPRAGANRISMAEIFRGRYCGLCHDRVAFITFFSCNRCHAVPRDTPDAHDGP